MKNLGQRLYKWIFPYILIISVFLIGNCTIDPIKPPTLPTFYQTINIPLANTNLPLANLQDSLNHIFGDSLADSLWFFFEGSLDTTTLTKDIFVVPTAMDIAFSQEFSEISGSDISFDTTFSKIMKLSDHIHVPGVSLPFGFDVTLDSLQREPLINENHKIKIFDKYSVPYFKRVDYLTIGSGTFSTEITNELLVDIDSVNIELYNIDGESISKLFFDKIPAGESRSKGEEGNLAGKKMSDSVAIQISAIFAGTDGEPLLIPAETDPFVDVAVRFAVDSVESFTGIPEPIELSQSIPIPSSNNTIIRGIYSDVLSDSPDTNQITFQVQNDMQVNIDLDISFLNFYGSSGMLNIHNTYFAGTSGSDILRLDNDTLRNSDASTIVDSIIVQTFVNLVPDVGDTVTTIPLSSLDQSLDININVAIMQFSEIVGFFNESFAIPPITIEDIPTGFSGIDFGNVFLNLKLNSEIQASTDLNLEIGGYRTGYEPEIIEIIQTINKASDTNPVAESSVSIDIAPVFNLMPDSIMVDGDASIPANDTSKLQVGKSFWGNYEITVPFKLKLDPLTFIPVSSTTFNPISSQIAEKLRSGFIEAKVISKVENNFPLACIIEILISDFDYFPMDSSTADSGYNWIGDSLFADTDTGLIHIKIDTLVSIELPKPNEFNQDGSVKIPSILNQHSNLDSLTFESILEDKVHYIRPRVYLIGTEDYVTVKLSDEIKILTLISVTMEAGKFIGLDNDESSDTLEIDNLSRITTNGH